MYEACLKEWKRIISHLRVTIHRLKIFMLLKQEFNFWKTIISVHAQHGGKHFTSNYFYHVIYDGEKV